MRIELPSNAMGPKPPTLDEIQIMPDSLMRTLHTMDHRPYTICMVLREIYVQEDDPEIRKKLQYAATIAEYVCTKLWSIDPEWIGKLYPRRRDYERLMERAT